MKILKTILIVVVALVAIVFIATLFMPRKHLVERSVLVNAPAEAAFHQINDLKNWRNWSPWYKMDTAMVMSYSENAEGVGAWYSWKSTNPDLDEGKLTILESKPYEWIKVQMQFRKWGTSEAYYRFTPTDTGTVVLVGMETDTEGNPLTKLQCVIMGMMLGKQFENGLRDLKTHAEKTALAADPDLVSIVGEIRDTTAGGFFYLSIKDSCAADAITAKLGELMPEIMVNAETQGLQQAGAVYAVYYQYDPQGTVVLEAGIPVSAMGKSAGRVKAGKMAKTKAIYVPYYGDYAATDKAHYAIDKYITSNSRTVTGAPWEVYVTDPSMVKNKKELLTMIYYPVN